MRITGQPSSNTVQIDAIQVKVHHVAGGGGGGGGGEASLTKAVFIVDALVDIFDKIRFSFGSVVYKYFFSY